MNSVEYAKWLMDDQCKTLLNMSNQQIADVLGVSRPTVDTWKKNYAVMPAGKLDTLVSHLEYVKAAILTTEATDPDLGKAYSEQSDDD